MKDIQDLIAKLTLEEKASLCSGQDFWHLKGIERLEIPSILVTDGPHGLRKQLESGGEIRLNKSVPATCFPTASALAATWNRDLIYEVGVALGEECRQEKVAVLLGPGANIKRSPLCGRNFEYFSEDPYLAGELAKSHINGVQSQGIGASLKHYAANNQEYRRMTINAVIDERALREIYLAGFEIAVKDAQPWTVMSAYNRVNGTYCSEHPHLLRRILKEEWGHQGLTVTDWGAMNDPVAALIAGLDLEMPGSNNGNQQRIIAAIDQGELTETTLDQAVERILKLIFKAQETLMEDFTYDPEAHHALARRAAGEGAVLLKNRDQILPLKKGTKVALLGEFAKKPRYQGAGSSLVNPTQLDNLFDEMAKIAGAENISYSPGCGAKGEAVDDNLILEALDFAKEADVVVISAGLPDIYEVEGVDRQHLKLPESHNQLIEAIAAVHDNVVVVLSNGAPVEMPWIDRVQGVLEGYLGGQAGAGGVADILYGIVNPSGKLAETFPLKLEDTPCHAYFPGGPKTVEYRESIYVGYRFYETVGKEVLFPFGHGLSYTTFKYRDLQLSQTRITDQDTLTVRLKVENTGAVEGKEIVQLYVSPIESTAFRPEIELKGFQKVSLLPGEEKEVQFTLDRRAFAYFNTTIKDWHIESGTYWILAGSSSQEIHLRAAVAVSSTQTEIPISARDQLYAYDNFPADAQIRQETFESLLGKPVPPNQVLKGEPYTINTCIADMEESFVARQLNKIIEKQVQEQIKDDPDSPNARMTNATVKEAPPRLLMNFSDQLNRGMLDGVMLMINQKPFQGLLTLLQAAWRRRK